MQKLIIWSLAIVMTLGVFVGPAQAMEPMRLNQEKEITTGNKGRRPPPRRDRGRGHDRGRRSHSNSGWGWAVAGVVIGGAIASGIAESHRQPEPVLVCDAYGYCYYVYR